MEDRITRETRRESYDAVLPKVKARSGLILETLGSKSMTVSEITEALVKAGAIPYFNRNYVAPRMTELKQAGIVETCGRRRATKSDATEAVWRRVVPGAQPAPAAPAQPTRAAAPQRASEPGVATCRACGAPIRWIRTTAGKSMPCDAKPRPYYPQPGAKSKLVTPEGSVVSGEIADRPNEATEIGYVPHWSTCTNPDKFRRKR